MLQLLPGEEIIMIRRRHWLPFVSKIFILLFAAVLPLFFFAAEAMLPYAAQRIIASFDTFPTFLWLTWILFLWIFFGVNWTNYYLDALIITNKRVIDIDQIGLFARDIAEVRIQNVEDTRVEVLGIIASFLHFGNLHIQTAGESREFIIHNIPRPQEISDAIARAADALRSHREEH